MPQMSPGQARVVDPVLTNVARGYRNALLIGMMLFPYVPVPQRGGKIIQFGQEDFELFNTARTPGSATKRVQFGHAGAPYALEQHALEGQVPYELQEESAVVPGIDQGSIAVQKTQNIIALRLEYQQAGLATDAANYAATNKITLSGTAQWSDYANSDPLDNISTAKEAIRSQTGMRPDTLVIGAAVLEKLKYHPKLLQAAVIGNLVLASDIRAALSLDVMASVLGVRRVLSGDAVYRNNAGTMTDVWGKSAILAVTDTGGIADMGMPSYGYTYRLRNYPIVEQPYQDRNAKSWIYPVTDEVSPVIAGADAGYLISAAVA